MESDRPKAVCRIAIGACAAMMAAAIGGGADEAKAVHQIERYCTTSWRNAQIARQDWPDCTQQAMLTLLERIPRDRLADAINARSSDERKELNRSIWCIVQRWRRARRPLPLGAADCPDYRAETESDTLSHAKEMLDELDAAMDCLTARQQAILSLLAQGDAISEVADSLEMSPARVSDEKYKAIRKLRKYFAELDGSTVSRDL